RRSRAGRGGLDRADDEGRLARPHVARRPPHRGAGRRPRPDPTGPAARGGDPDRRDRPGYRFAGPVLVPERASGGAAGGPRARRGQRGPRVSRRLVADQTALVQNLQRVALARTLSPHAPHVFIAGAGAGGASRISALVITKTKNAMMTKSTTVPRKL